MLYVRDGSVWMNQNQLAELFDTSVPNVCMHIANILKEWELQKILVIKKYLTTASDGKKYEVTLRGVHCTSQSIGNRRSRAD